MDQIVSRLPNPIALVESLHGWSIRNRVKIAGFAAGSLGTFILTTFLVVAITGVPFGGERLDPDRTTVYPNY